MQEPMDCGGFLPDYVSPPGDTVLESPLYAGVYHNTLAGDLGLIRPYPQAIEDFLRGATRIDVGLAAKLSMCVGSTPAFWLRRDSQYVADCARLGLVPGGPRTRNGNGQ